MFHMLFTFARSRNKNIRGNVTNLTLYNLSSTCFKAYLLIRNEELKYYFWNINILICSVQTLVMDLDYG